MPLRTPATYTDPLTVLPPVFGTMLSAGPDTSASPSPAETVNVISCAFATSALYPDTAPPCRPAPTPGPPTGRRPLWRLRPPGVPNTVMPGVSCTLAGDDPCV